MLTPKFKVDQEDDFVIVLIHAPYVKISEVEFVILENQFKFYVRPYFLRLTFSGEVVEDGREKAVYDPATGDFTVHVPKLHAGEVFENLDLLTELLATRKSASTKPKAASLIQELDSGGEAERGGNEEDEGEENEEDFEEDQIDDDMWEVEQTVPADDDEEGNEPSLFGLNSGKFNYGFDRKYHGVLGPLFSELPDVNELRDVERVPLTARAALRKEDQDSRFDDEHYLADFLEPEQFEHLLRFKVPWVNEALKRSLSFMIEKVRCHRCYTSSCSYQPLRRALALLSTNSSESPLRTPGSDSVGSNTETNVKNDEVCVLASSLSALHFPVAKLDHSLPSSYDKNHNPELEQKSWLSFSLINVNLLQLILTPIKCVSPSCSVFYKSIISSFHKEGVTFSEEDNERMLKLPRKQLIVDHPYSTSLSLLSIILAYCYDQRITEGEGNVETAWTVYRLSSALSFLEEFRSVEGCVLSFVRSALCYPLFRNLDLCRGVLNDAITIFLLGRRAILKCLLDIRSVFEKDEVRYVYNEIFLTDLCVWVQSCKESLFRPLLKELYELKPTKEDFGFNLEVLEELGLEDKLDRENHSCSSDDEDESSNSEDSSQSDTTTSESENEDSDDDDV